MAETRQDILAEMRGVTELWGSHAVCATSQTVSQWSDRIEAAAKREEIELREDEAKMLLREYAAAPDDSLTPSALSLKRELLALAPQGNAAAMREAVGNALWCLNWMAENTGDKPTKDHLAKPIELLTAALDAPPRNCDRFADYASALEYWQTHEECAEVNGCFDVWLFATTEGEEASNG